MFRKRKQQRRMVISNLRTNGTLRTRWAIIIVALSAPILALITFDHYPPQSGFIAFFRVYSVPVLVLEALVCCLAVLDRGSLYKIMRSLPRWAMAALAIVIAVALGTLAFVADDVEPAAVRTAAWLLHLAFGVSIAALVRKGQLDDGGRNAWRLILYGLCTYFAILMLFVATIPDNSRFIWDGFWLGVVNVRQLGFFSAAGYAVAIGVALVARDGRGRLVAATAAAALIGISFWTGTRSSILGVFLALGVAVLFVPIARRALSIIVMAGSLAGGLALGFIHIPPDDDVQVLRFFSPAKQVGARRFDSGRLAMWKATIDAIEERPFFGHGESQFRNNDRKISFGYNHPHNSILQFLYQWGLVGGGLLLMLFGYAWARVVGVARRHPDIGLPALLVTTSLFGMSLIEGSFYHSWPVMMTVFAISVALAADAPPKMGDQQLED
jgi:O-antigen ligase